jgi:hypothetical protein
MSDGPVRWRRLLRRRHGVWAVPVGAPIRNGRAWTVANNYTGGDMQPIVVPGGIIYTKYVYDQNGNRTGQLWFTNRAGSAGRALTSTDASCAQPSLSPDGGSLAMICTYQKQVSYLKIESWNGSKLGGLRMLLTDQLVASRGLPTAAGSYLARAGRPPRSSGFSPRTRTTRRRRPGSHLSQSPGGRTTGPA